MPARIRWGNQAHSFVLMCLTGEVEPEDFFAAQVEIKALMDEADGKVDIAADFSAVDAVSTRLLVSLPRIIAHMHHPNSSRTRVIIHVPPLMRKFLDLFSNMLDFTFVDTLEEAEAVLARPSARPPALFPVEQNGEDAA